MSVIRLRDLRNWNKSKESLEDSSETKKKQTRNRIQNATEMNVDNFLNSLRNVKI